MGVSASLRAVARTGRIEFESQVLRDGVLPCEVRVVDGDAEWPPVRTELQEDDRFELLAFFEDLIGFGDLPHPASVTCEWPGFPLSFEGRYSGDRDNVSLRVVGDWTKLRDLRDAELLVPRARLMTFWPQLAAVMRRT